MIIAEIGSNWEGSISIAKKIIKECKKAGSDAVKFQMWRAIDLYSPSHPNWNEIKNSELTFSKAKKIKDFCDSQKIEFFCSCFYPESVTFLESLNVKQYKIASRTCLLKDPFSKETLEKIALTKKSVIVSMGMGGNKKYLTKLFAKNKTLDFCYCISDYPLEFKKINGKLAKTFTGFSDHTMDIIAPIIFAGLKKQQNSKKIIIEKHIKLESSLGPDASTSISTKELAKLVSYVRNIEKKFD